MSGISQAVLFFECIEDSKEKAMDGVAKCLTDPIMYPSLTVFKSHTWLCVPKKLGLESDQFFQWHLHVVGSDNFSYQSNFSATFPDLWMSIHCPWASGTTVLYGNSHWRVTGQKFNNYKGSMSPSTNTHLKATKRTKILTSTLTSTSRETFCENAT